MDWAALAPEINSGPISGKQVVPCSWQNQLRSGPFLPAGDRRGDRHRASFVADCTAHGSH